MKVLITSLFILLISFQSQASSNVFKCFSRIEIDTNEFDTVGITIVQNDSTYLSYLLGSGETGPLATMKQTLSPTEIFNVNGFTEILHATHISPQDFANVDKIEVYTAGNFEDDAAGVKAVQFMDKDGVVLAKGMFFGWAGAMVCQ